MPAHREQLEALRDSINPRSLRSEIYHDVDAIFKLPCAESCWPQNIHLTLAQNRDNGKETLSDLEPDTPWHLSRYFPAYRFDRSGHARLHAGAGPRDRHEGRLPHVYLGNVPRHGGENTVCPECGTILVRRDGFGSSDPSLTPEGRCPPCVETIPGVGW